jgi:CDP-diglyceride synthetase
MRGYADLFFMGVAFLLLETKSVVQFALLFGTTWFVNALVFVGVLLSVLAAVEVARRVRLPHPAYLYAVLLAALIVAWLVPSGALLQLDLMPRFLVATLVWFTPIFVANLVFAERFRAVEKSHVAFGANLLGAMVGGLLEYAALLTGYQALIILVALLYGAAFACGTLAFGIGRRSATRASPAT